MEIAILETKEYEKFKYIEGNRNIESKHVNELIKSISEKNLLSIRPIIVDKDFNILDGQHRLEAAKSLNLPIFYIQIQSDLHSEMVRLNQNNKNWKIKDFLHFHSIKNKNQNYIRILQVMDKFSWNIQEVFIYTGYEVRKGVNRKRFEDGNYIFESEDEELIKYYSQWKTLEDFVKEKGLEHAECVYSQVFKEAFLFFSKAKAIKLDQFWEKLRAHPNLFYRCRNKDEYLDLFLRIYNQGMVYKVEKGMLV